MTTAVEHKDINLLLSANSPCHWRGAAECLEQHLYEEATGDLARLVQFTPCSSRWS